MTVGAIRDAVRRAVAFLASAQQSGGGFPIASSPSRLLESADDVVSPFAAAIVLLALDRVAEVPAALRSRAIAHLLSRRESTGLIRFDDSPIDPDYDDICLIHSLLQDANVALDYRRIARRVASACGDDDLFPTWVGKDRQRDFDAVVNVNVVRFLDRNGIDCSKTIARLRAIAEQWAPPHEGTRYYPPPAALPWIVCTLPTSLRMQIAGVSRNAFCEKLAGTAPASLLDVAMRAFALARLGGSPRALLIPLLDAQHRDGGWPAEAIFCGARFWGSRALTTAIAVQALSEMA